MHNPSPAWSSVVKHGDWSQRIGAFSALPALIRQLGADPRAALESVGLGPDALDVSEGSVSYGALTQLLREAAERTGCEHLGVLAGRLWHLSDLGLMGELVRNSATVGDALRTLSVYQHLNSQGGVAFLLERGGMADLGYAVYYPSVDGVDFMYDAVLAGGFNFVRELCGGGWCPTEVLIQHGPPLDTSAYRNLFKVKPRFNAEFSALRFPAHWLQRPIEGASQSRFNAAEVRAKAAGAPDLLQQVYRALRIMLLDGRNSGDDVAHILSMHRRTLNRRLREKGTTFQEVLDHVRFDVAQQLLAQADVSLDDVAAALGYAGVSPFMRTFRRWSGTTPGRWRRRVGAKYPADGISSARGCRASAGKRSNRIVDVAA